MRTLIAASGITKAYGRQTVLDGLSFTVHEKARIALIGRNGAGKTTLLRIMAGADRPDGGDVRHMPNLRLGTLDQHDVLPDGIPTVEHLMDASGRPKWECEKLAAKFGLKGDDLARPPAALSGGYQMRVKIVRMLLRDPNLLLLDEPVNYLDLPTLVLFERFLLAWSGAYVVTSHDRDLLENLCTTTWEVEGGALTVFPGEVDVYLDWKEEQAEYARRTNKKLRKEMADAQAFVDRFKAKASQASRAQSKMKHIAKLRARLKELDPSLPVAAFRITCMPPPSGPALECRDLSIGYVGVQVASGISLELPRGAKVGIVGENGRGKTTLLKTFAGVLPPVEGKCKWWPKADVGYFSQLSEETLASQATVLQALTEAAPADASSERILAAAGAFLFREDDLEKPCGVLSGGERARVRLARLVLREHNVLLLDEPTNHLDAETVEVLARALKDYPGTVVVVSHARTFMNALVDRIYEVRAGTVRHYVGTYEEYVAELTAYAAAVEELPSVHADTPEAAEKRERAMRSREVRRVRQRLEAKLKEFEAEKSAILAFFFDNPTEYAPDKQRRLTELEEAIAAIESEWSSLEE